MMSCKAKISIGITALFLLLGLGCATPYPSGSHVPADEPGHEAPDLTAYDVRLIVEALIRQMRNEWVSEGRQLGRLPIIAYAGIRNDTPYRIHTDEILGFISREILNSGLATFTTAIRPDGTGGWSGETYKLIDFSDPDINPYVDPDSAPAPRGIRAPDYQLHGRIYAHRELPRGNRREVNYTAELSLSNVRTGVLVFQGMHPVRKNVRR